MNNNPLSRPGWSPMRLAQLRHELVVFTPLSYSYLPVRYGTLAWWPHNQWARIISGPVATWNT